LLLKALTLLTVTERTLLPKYSSTFQFFPSCCLQRREALRASGRERFQFFPSCCRLEQQLDRVPLVHLGHPHLSILSQLLRGYQRQHFPRFEHDFQFFPSCCFTTLFAFSLLTL